MSHERQTLPDGVAAQHGHLVQMIRSLRQAHASGQGWEVLAVQLDSLLDDVREHFSYEELVMERGAYPKRDAHRQQHVSFVRRIEALRRECDRRETELMSVLVELLETWFRNHEQSADRAVAEFLNIEI
jgi:hemerythrin-like metal-binding protein